MGLFRLCNTEKNRNEQSSNSCNSFI